MPNCTSMGPGWVEDANGQCIFSGGTSELDTGAPVAGAFTGTTSSLDYGDELAGSTLADDWQSYFDAYDPAREQMLTRHAGIDVEQLGEAWGLKSAQLGQEYQQQLGGLFEQAGTGMMDLMSSWGGGGQTMTGRKGRQRRDIGRAAEREAGGLGLGLRQGREAGKLQLGQATTDIYQGLETSTFAAREQWEKEQRSNLNTLLGMDIWGDDASTSVSRPPSINNPEYNQNRDAYMTCINSGKTREQCMEQTRGTGDNNIITPVNPDAPGGNRDDQDTSNESWCQNGVHIYSGQPC